MTPTTPYPPQSWHFLLPSQDFEGKVTRYTYYRDNLLHKVQIERNAVIVGEFVYTYDLAGRPETITYPEDNNNISVVAETWLVAVCGKS